MTVANEGSLIQHFLIPTQNVPRFSDLQQDYALKENMVYEYLASYHAAVGELKRTKE